MSQSDNTQRHRKTQTSKGQRRNAQRTSDMHAPFVSGNLADERKAKDRMQKLFVTSIDSKRMKTIKPFRGGRGDSFIRGHLIADGDIQTGGFHNFRQAA